MAAPTRVLTFTDRSLYIQEGKNLVLIDAANGDTIKKWTLPFSSWQHRDRRMIRLLRLGVQSLIPISDEKVVIVENRKIYSFNLVSGKVDSLFTDFQGTRPLFLCQTASGVLVFGEYFNNPDRKPVNIYTSHDQGLTFRKIFTFPEGSIRHIHGVFFDRFTGDLWITTGDRDNESFIWRTTDQFKEIEPILGGKQQYRAVQLLFTKDFIYFGSDTPLERNYIYRLERKTGIVEQLQEIQGTVFFGCNVGEYLFFSTVVEPSSINKDRRVYLWGSKNGKTWQCIKSFRKDMLPLKLFQYGQIKFPSGFNETSNLWFTPFSTMGDQSANCISVENIFDID